MLYYSTEVMSKLMGSDRQTMPNDSKALAETGERMVPERSVARIFWEHVERYRFASGYIVGKRVLDVACGEGYGSAALRRAGASQVIGVDIAPEVCEHARTKYGLEVRLGNAQALPIDDASVDVVVSFETIEHVPDPRKFLEECARVLAPGGILILSTPNRPVYSSALNHNPFHHQEFDRKEFLDLLQSKFRDIQLYGQTLKSAPWWSLGSLRAEESPWKQIKGFWRVTSWICPALRSEVDPDIRASIGEVANLPSRGFASVFNPFVIRRSLRDDPSTYWLAVALVSQAEQTRAHA